MLQNLRNLITIGVAKLFYPQGGMQQVKVKIREGEMRDQLEHAQPYGFAHLPHADSETINLFPAGDKGFGLVICVHNRRYRMQLNDEGDVAIYDHEGQTVHLKRDGILLKSSKQVTVDSPNTHITGNVVIDKECTISGIAFTPHTHGGVDTGLGSTRPPNR